MAHLLPVPALTQALSLIRPVARNGDDARAAQHHTAQPLNRSKPNSAAPKAPSRMGMGDASEIAKLARRYESAALSAARSASK